MRHDRHGWELTAADHQPAISVASFPDYKEAERAVDRLADRKFPVQHVTIVAEGLRLVENVTGRLVWWRSGLVGLFNGALIGALIGFFLGFLNYFNPLVSSLVLATNGALIGAIVGFVFGLVGYGLRNRARDFTSQSSVEAQFYNLMVQRPYADRARELLGTEASAGVRRHDEEARPAAS